MEIKADRRGIRLLAHGFESEDSLIEDLDRTLAERAAFLGLAHLLVEIDGVALTSSLFQRISETFTRYPQLTVRGIVEHATPLVALDVRPTPELSAPAKVIRHTIRSGQRMVHQGDLIIVGDVNPGAHVVAAGDVMIFGWLRGTVSAGQPDDTTRSIYALRFDPTQIRIGPVLALGDTKGGNPEKARVEEGQLVVLAWDDVRLPEAITHERSQWTERFSHATPS